MDNIMVSIICLSYNHEKYIGQTLENFLNQKTNFKIQVIVHDDASTDNTQKIIKEYAEKAPDVIDAILQEKNQYSIQPQGGIYKNFINPKIKGKYIAICEGDDFWCDENKLQKQVDFLEAHPEYTMCVHNSKFLDMSTNEESPFNKEITEDRDLDFDYVVDGLMNKFHMSSWLYRTEYHMSMPAFCHAIKGVGDYPRALHLAAEGKIRFMADTMSVYRYRSTATSWTSKNKSTKNDLENIKKYVSQRVTLLEMVKETYPETTKSVDKAIKRKQFEIVKKTGDFKAVRSDEFYKQLYGELGIKDKCKFLVRRFIK